MLSAECCLCVVRTRTGNVYEKAGSNIRMDVGEIFHASGKWVKQTRVNAVVISSDGTSRICCHSTGNGESWLSQYHGWFCIWKVPLSNLYRDID
jgi:hypothetical protein